jgi:hypothetical protein
MPVRSGEPRSAAAPPLTKQARNGGAELCGEVGDLQARTAGDAKALEGGSTHGVAGARVWRGEDAKGAGVLHGLFVTA